MPTLATRNPRAATCEDWDEDNEASLSNARSHADDLSATAYAYANANVARKRSQSHDSDNKSLHDKKSHNGSDSGYSSKAGTNENISSGRRKIVDLKVDTEVIMERERQPYAQKQPKTLPTRQASVKKKEATKERAPAKSQERPFRHHPGDCVTCDHYEVHIEPMPPIPPTSVPPSPKTIKTTSKAKDDLATHNKSRRSSSKHEGRPASVLILAPPPQLVYSPEYAHPALHPQPYPYQLPSPITPTTHVVPYQQQPHFIPETPFSTPYSPHPSGYLDSYMAAHEAHHYQMQQPGYYPPPEPAQPYYYHYPAQEPPQPHPHPAYGSIPRSVTRSNRSVEEDRRAMPPPARPGLKKSTTDRSSKRQSVHYEHEERPDVSMKCLSREISHPPTAYKAPLTEAPTRPRPSKSYSTGSGPVVVPSTSRPRHNTDPSQYHDPVDRQMAEAERHIAQTSREPTNELTAESLKKISSRPLASDDGTQRTYKSKESSRSKISTSAKTTIFMDNGVSLSLPQDLPDRLSVTLGKLTLSVNNQDEESSRIREQRQLEPRSASDASRAPSRRSTTSGSAEGQSARKEASRKSAYPESTNHSANSSKRSSRPSSSAGAA